MNTPLHIQLLLHCHAIAEPIPNRGAPAVEAYLRDLVDAGLIGHAHTPSGFQATEKGRDYVYRLREVLSLPDPKTPLVDSVKKAVPPSVRTIEYPGVRLEAKFLVTGSDSLYPKPVVTHRSVESAVQSATTLVTNNNFTQHGAIVWKPFRLVRRKAPVLPPIEVVELS